MQVVSAMSIEVALAVSLWIGLSSALILFNASILQDFRYPISLICWHQLVASVLILVVRLVRPSWVVVPDSNPGAPALTFAKGFTLGTPVAIFHVASMIAGNGAYLYLSVSFIQMIKAFTSVNVYLVGCLMGTQTWSWPVAKTILVCTFGLVIASLGEVRFDPFGCLIQCISIVLEGFRINLLEILLKSKGYQFNPLSSLSIFAPIMLILLVPCVAIFDYGSISKSMIDGVGKFTFLVNGLIAFGLNLSVYLVIQRASGLVFALGGILKDVLIILGSTALFMTPITPMQVFGYAVALVALQAYGVVSKSPSDFDNGVLAVLVPRFVTCLQSVLHPIYASGGKMSGEQVVGLPEELEELQEVQAESPRAEKV